MARLVTIKGCGPMVCSSYGEVAAAIDRAFASPKDQALPTGEAFAALAEGLAPAASPEFPAKSHAEKSGPHLTFLPG